MSNASNDTTSTNTPNPSAGWFADPTGRWSSRWFDGVTWTDQVTDGASVFTEGPASVGAPNRTPHGPTQQRSGLAIAGIIVGAVVGLAIVGFVGLVIVGILAGDDGAGEGAAADLGFDGSVPGANVVESVDSEAGRTTWFVVLDSSPRDADLSAIATDVVSLPAASDVDTLDVLFFDEGGDELQVLIDATIELDELSNDVELDFDRILELSSVFASDWVADHSVGALTPTDDSTYELCIEPLGVSCSAANTETVIAE